MQIGCYTFLVTQGVVRTIRAGVASFIAALCVLGVVSSHRGALTVTFLDVGQGDAILIQTPSNISVLVDGGKDERTLKRLHEHMPFFNKTLDVVVATHLDADHVGGLADVIGRYLVREVYYSPMEHDTPQVTLFERAIINRGITPKELHAGDVLVIDADTVLHVLHPIRGMATGDTNSASTVLRLVHKDVSFLLTGDAPVDVEHALAHTYGAQLQSSVLKLGHHGSYTSTSDVFLGYVRPQYAIISRGCDNEYGHPHVEVVNRLVEFKIPALDTCLLGSITIESTGTALSVIH